MEANHGGQAYLDESDLDGSRSEGEQTTAVAETRRIILYRVSFFSRGQASLVVSLVNDTRL